LKFRQILALILLLTAVRSSALNVDSLWKLIRSEKSSDTVKIKAYYDLGWEFIYSDPDSSFNLGKRALKLTINKNYKVLESKVYNLLGSCSQVKGNFIEAIEYYQKAMVIGEQIKNDNILLVAYGNIGSLYINLGRFKLALDYQLKSMRIAEKANNREKLGTIYNNLCIVYTESEDFQKGIDYGIKSIEINEEFDDKNNLCSAYGNLGSAYHRKGDLRKALLYYNKCLILSKETDNPFETAKATLDLGEIQLSLKNYNEALIYFKESLVLATKMEIAENLRGSYHGLYKSYNGLNDTKRALENLEKYNLVLSTTGKDENEKEVSQKVMEYNYQLLSFKDSLRNAEEAKFKDLTIQAGQAQIEKDKILQVALVIGLILVFGFGVLIFNRFRIENRQKKIIEEKNKQTEEQKLIIEEKQKEILDSISYAKRIQDSLLDNFDSVGKFFSDAFLLNLPKDIVSGDFYWIARKTQTQKNGNDSIVSEFFYLAVCDSTGHGVPGGFMSLLNMSYLSEALNEKSIHLPNKIFDYVRERLINTISKSHQKDGFDGVLLCFEKKSFFSGKELTNTSIELSYAGAYNPPLLVRNGEMKRLAVDKMPVGYSPKNQSFVLHTVPLQKGDHIYLCTDGYGDQFGGANAVSFLDGTRSIGTGKKFQNRQLEELLMMNSSLAMSEQKKLLNERFIEWKGDIEQIDDICVVGIKV
jgi:serine phosphatase RsbU (regulator of sigma subunit)